MGYLEDRRSWKQFGKPKKVKEQYVIPKKSVKKLAEEKAEREERGEDDTQLQKWFVARMKQMTGRCAETGLVTERKIYRYAIMSICHLLPKRLCPSVMYHPLNWIELNVDIHYKFDNSLWSEIETWGCYETIRGRLIAVYGDIAENEKRHFPESVLKYMKKHSLI